MPAKIMCLSIRQPWADLVVRGIKTEENRNWKTLFRGLVLIHSPSNVDNQWELRTRPALQVEIKKILRRRLIASHGLDRPKRNRIIGAVVLAGCTQKNLSRWCEPGLWHLHFSSAIKFHEPIPFHHGQLRLFSYPDGDRISQYDLSQLNDLRDQYRDLCGDDIISPNPKPAPRSENPSYAKFKGMRRDPVTQKWIQDGSPVDHVTIHQQRANKRTEKQAAARSAEQQKADQERLDELNERNKASSPSGTAPPKKKPRPHKPYRKRARSAKRRKLAPPKPKQEICKRYCEQFRPPRYVSGGPAARRGPDTWASCRLHRTFLRHIKSCDVYTALLKDISKGK